ncbi:hypothetical protein JCM8097_008237 [Rhodosporidiobolus ruineniae]
MATTTASTAPKAPRSQFLQKLHALLENPLDPDGLRWVSDESFEISSKDAVAIHALSPQFEFHSLSSFIRQLSYYSFRRLSDRRRSTERRASNTGYISFTHPSGFFVRGDATKLNQIIRKARNRPDKGRRISMCSVTSDDYAPPPPIPMPQWQPPDFRPQFGADRQPLPSLHNLPSFVTTLNPPQHYEAVTQWRNYSPSTSSWLDPNRADPEDHFDGPAYRRASLGDFKLNPTGTSSSSFVPGNLAALPEGRPGLRKAVSSQELPTVGSLASGAGYQQQQQPQPSGAVESSFRSSPYPTPTFDSSASNYFASHGATAAYSGYPAVHPQQQEYASAASHHYAPPSHPAPHSHLTYEPIPSHFSSSYEPVAPNKAAGSLNHPPSNRSPSPYAHGTHSPSPTQSPTQHSVPLPGTESSSSSVLDPRHLVGGVPALHHHTYAAGAPSSSAAEYASQTVPPSGPSSVAQQQQPYDASPRTPYSGLPRMAVPPSSQYFPSSYQPTAAYAQQQHQAPGSTTFQPWSPPPIRTAY